MTETRRRSRAPAALVVIAAAAGLLIVQLAVDHQRAPWTTVGVFAAFLIWATTFSASLNADLRVTADVMVVLAAVGAFAGRGGVLAATLVGLSGGCIAGFLGESDEPIRWRLLTLAFNCAQFAIAGAAAGVAFARVASGGIGWVLLAAGAAALAYAIVNMSLVLFVMVAGGEPARPALHTMTRSLPDFFSFGVVGVLVGQLYTELGLVSLALLVVPVIVSRQAYRATTVLQEARDATVTVFLRALAAKDEYTARHTQRVARYAGYIGEELGLRSAQRTKLRHAALMHDIGKLAVSPDLLNKPGPLTPEEYQEVCRHNEVCVAILAQVGFLRSTIATASDEHATFDSTASRHRSAIIGYAVAVADAFDAMTSTRSYRRALSQAVAFEELRQGRGRQFHPGCVDALIRAIERRGECYGAGHEVDAVEFASPPPVTGVGSASLGHLVLDGSEGRPA